MPFIYDKATNTYQEVDSSNQTVNGDSTNSKKDKATRGNYEASPKYPKTNLPGSLNVLRIILYAVAGYFVFLNIRPYIGFVDMMLSLQGDNSINNLIQLIPVVRDIINVFGEILKVVIGVFLWFVLQAFELLPLFIFNNRSMLATMIDAISKSDYIPVSTKDSPLVAKLKNEYNRLPYKWVRNIVIYAGFAYFFDLLLAVSYYPPINGDPWLVITAFVPSDINITNVIAISITLFAVEIIVITLLWLNEIIKHFKRRQSTNG